MSVGEGGKGYNSLMKDIRTKIADGDYENKLPLFGARYSAIDRRCAQEAYRQEQNRLGATFKQDALEATGFLQLNSDRTDILFKHSKADAVWDKAWDSHHAYGLLEVLNELEELAELILS